MEGTADDLLNAFVQEWRRQRPDLDFAAMEVTARVVHLSALIQRAWSAAATDFDLGTAALQALLALRRVGPPFELTPTDLCRESFLSSGGMTQLLDRLESRRLVERAPHPRDRRGLLVRLTPEGLGLADEAVARRLAGAQAIVAGLNASEQQTLVSLLQTLLGSAETVARGTP